MSATNRGAKREDHDFYPTEPWAVRRLLDHVQLPGTKWLEPGAGSGSIIKVVEARRPDVEWTAVELRPDAEPYLAQTNAKVEIADFLRDYRGGPFDLALGNPPFKLAQEFVERSLSMANEVVFLLRIAFLASAKRREFYRRVGLPDVYVLPERCDFTGEGGDSADYAWFRWYRDSARAEGNHRILYDEAQLSLLEDA